VSSATPLVSPMGRKDFLDLFKVPTKGNVFVLGCFAQHVTIYSQQVRALNLIWALQEEVGLNQSSIGIVGAGVAGLTAAAAGLILGAHVTLFEKQPDVLTLQKNNSKRWLHPHIYDWPFTNEPDQSARLPILNWTASVSEVVAGTLIKEWDRIAKRYEGFLDFNPSVNIATLTENAGRDPVLSWNGKPPREFSAVILAVGFGLEGGKPRDSYWSLDDIDADFGPPERCLVSGYGDGALIDLMRLCSKDFRQDEIVDLFANVGGTRSVIDRIKQIESDVNSGDDVWLTKQYESLNLTNLQEFLQQRRRVNRHVYLAGTSPWRYSSRSSALNKFIVSQLDRIGAFSSLNCGPLKAWEQVEGGVRVSWSDGSTELYDRVVARHGPIPALQRDIWDLCEPLRLRWAAIPRHADPTRMPMWPNDYWEGKDVEVAESSALRLDRPVATSMIEMVSRTMTSPKYKDDLARLDQHWKLEAVIGRPTIVIVVGSTPVCELLDRPVAYYLRDLIDQAGSGLTPYHRAVVFSDDVWSKNEGQLKSLAFVSIGGDKSNSLTKRLLGPTELNPDKHEWEMGEGSKGFFRKIRKDCPQVALYGNTAARTRRAVETYVEKEDGLRSFLQMCWGPDYKPAP
jgi:hypothetical protein